MLEHITALDALRRRLTQRKSEIAKTIGDVDAARSKAPAPEHAETDAKLQARSESAEASKGLLSTAGKL